MNMVVIYLVLNDAVITVRGERVHARFEALRLTDRLDDRGCKIVDKATYNAKKKELAARGYSKAEKADGET